MTLGIVIYIKQAEKEIALTKEAILDSRHVHAPLHSRRPAAFPDGWPCISVEDFQADSLQLEPVPHCLECH